MSKNIFGAIILSIVAISPALAQKQVLMAQESLQKGQYLETRSKIYRLVMQDDGKVVRYMYSPFGYVRTTEYEIKTSNGQYLHMQQDGNAAIYTSSGTWAWNSKSGGNPIDLTYKLVLRESGVVQIMKGNVLHKELAGFDIAGNAASQSAFYPSYTTTNGGSCVQSQIGVPGINFLQASQRRAAGETLGYCSHPYN
jgi:hypothetical protein